MTVFAQKGTIFSIDHAITVNVHEITNTNKENF